jgi:transposase
VHVHPSLWPSWALRMRISDDLRWRIKYCYERLQRISSVAKELGLSRATVRLWVNRHFSNKGIRDAPGRGRKGLICKELASNVAELLQSDDHPTANSVAKKLNADGLAPRVVHRSTITRAVHRLARDGGTELSFRRGRPRKRLKADTRHKRLLFAEQHKKQRWLNTLFTDRKKFLFSYPGERVGRGRWVKKGDAYEAITVNHPQVVNVYAGICRFGVTSCHVVAGTSQHHSSFQNKQGKQAKNITAAEYENVLLTTLLPEGERLFRRHSVSAWVLQQDNDPTHNVAKKVVPRFNEQRAFRGCRVSLLAGWPPNSPDLNPIENFWSWVDAKVSALGCKTFLEFKKQLFLTISQAPKQLVADLVDSVHTRLALVRKLEGDRTSY